MKRITVIALIALFCAGFAFAQTNNMQKIYPTTSDEYKAISYLFFYDTISDGTTLTERKLF